MFKNCDYFENISRTEENLFIAGSVQNFHWQFYFL